MPSAVLVVGWWQVAQETSRLPPSSLSKNRACPSAALAGSGEGSGSSGLIPDSRITARRSRSSARPAGLPWHPPSKVAAMSNSVQVLGTRNRQTRTFAGQVMSVRLTARARRKSLHRSPNRSSFSPAWVSISNRSPLPILLAIIIRYKRLPVKHICRQPPGGFSPSCHAGFPAI